jgi:hypothetical protein
MTQEALKGLLLCGEGVYNPKRGLYVIKDADDSIAVYKNIDRNRAKEFATLCENLGYPREEWHLVIPELPEIFWEDPEDCPLKNEDGFLIEEVITASDWCRDNAGEGWIVTRSCS